MPRLVFCEPIELQSVSPDGMSSFFIFGSVLIDMSLPRAKPVDVVLCYSLSNPLSGQDRGQGVQVTDRVLNQSDVHIKA